MSKISEEVQRAITASDEQFADGDSEQCQVILDELADVDLAMQDPDLTKADRDKLEVRRLALGRLFHSKRCDAPHIVNA